MLATENSTDLNGTKLDWYEITAKFARSHSGKSLWQLLNTMIPYIVLWAAMVYLVQHNISYWIVLGLALLAGGVLVRIFILFHDCCHGSFFASRRANTIFGYVTGILTFTPFEDWRRAHNTHHATTADLDRRGVGDVWTMTVDEYLAAPRRRRIAYRLYRHPFITLGLGSAVLFLILHRFSTKGAGKRERRSVFRTNMAILFIAALASSTIGLRTYLLVQLPVILLAGSFGMWLFYLQHQFEDVYWIRHESRDPLKVALQGSSYFKLPKVLQWFTGNVGLHHVHHVRPSIPNYHLQRCHDHVPALQTVKVMTLRTSIRSLRLGLCDEKRKKLVSFRSLKTLSGAQ